MSHLDNNAATKAADAEDAPEVIAGAGDYLYLASWLQGTGALAPDNLMEDVATVDFLTLAAYARLETQA